MNDEATDMVSPLHRYDSASLDLGKFMGTAHLLNGVLGSEREKGSQKGRLGKIDPT